ncbi:PepSY-associated TM helix domain-containing protein [Pedobacter sp. ASV1-7]|uniref:PepSY-associated TM helix domain-containing protein n=1 Tax=Pedobacter sp. ASV1-7 TaxID=3145237 RepID=UPI0032E89525
MTAQKTKSTWQKIRKFFNDVHLWIGLASGIIVILICLSGTLYVFNTELREMASPELYNVKYEKGAKPIAVEELIVKVKESTGGKVASVKIPSDPGRSYQFMVRLKDKEEGGKDKSGSKDKGEATKDKGANKSGKGDKKEGKGKEGPGGGKRPSAFAVNQYTGEVLGNISASKTATASFMQTMFSLHRWLLLDKIEKPLIGELENRKLGSYISGTATILFTLGVITGMVIWFPQKIRAWKQGFKIKWSGSWKRKNHDLHNSLGLYSCIFLFLMGITGPQWSFPWYREALRKTLGTHVPEGAELPKDPISQLNSAGIKPLNIADYIASVDKAFPYTGDYSITMPKDSTAAVAITKNKTGFFAPSAGDKILLDQYNAAVLKMEVFKDKPFNERVSGSIKALHLGDVYGLFTKIIYFFACLIATSLPITGTIIWLNKLKKKNKSKKKSMVKQPVL